MLKKKKDELLHGHNHDGIDRRPKCIAWAGSGTLCVLQGGVLKFYSFSTFRKKCLPCDRAKHVDGSLVW